MGPNALMGLVLGWVGKPGGVESEQRMAVGNGIWLRVGLWDWYLTCMVGWLVLAVRQKWMQKPPAFRIIHKSWQ